MTDDFRAHSTMLTHKLSKLISIFLLTKSHKNLSGLKKNELKYEFATELRVLSPGQTESQVWDASWKLGSGYLWLRLARACVHLRWLAMTCAHFGRNEICTQVKAIFFSPFGHPTQVNASWVMSINLLLANEMVGSITSRCAGKEPALLPRTRESGGNRA